MASLVPVTRLLGARESGVDIERRIAAVYQSCRTPEHIAVAFDCFESIRYQKICELETNKKRLPDTEVGRVGVRRTLALVGDVHPGRVLF